MIGLSATDARWQLPVMNRTFRMIGIATALAIAFLRSSS
jgi:hypothetical protein